MSDIYFRSSEKLEQALSLGFTCTLQKINLNLIYPVYSCAAVQYYFVELLINDSPTYWKLVMNDGSITQ